MRNPLISYIGTLIEKAKESGKLSPTLTIDTQFGDGAPFSKGRLSTDCSSQGKRPPRLITDQLVNIFVQEWLQLFPILDRSQFLQLYASYMADEKKPDSLSDLKVSLALSVAAASTTNYEQEARDLGGNWQSNTAYTDNQYDLVAFEVSLLATIYGILTEDRVLVLHYWERAIAIYRHNSRHGSNAIDTDSQQDKEAWIGLNRILFILDCFTASILGVPQLLLLTEARQIFEAPSTDLTATKEHDTDTNPKSEENLASSALLQLAMVLSRVLDNRNQKARTGKHKDSITIKTLEKQLSATYEKLPSYLKLDFVHGKPSKSVVGSRAPILVR